MSDAIIDYTNGKIKFDSDDIRNHAKEYYTETVKHKWYKFIENAMKLFDSKKYCLFQAKVDILVNYYN